MNQELLPLRDIHLPEAISWWPFAYGWWLLFLFVILLIFSLFWWFKRAKKPLEIIPHALKQLEILYKSHQRDNHKFLQQVSILLRQTSIALYGRKKVAGLTGKKWLRFLDMQTKKYFFSEGIGQVFRQQIYAKNTKIDTKSCYQLIKGWLNEQHQIGK